MKNSVVNLPSEEVNVNVPLFENALITKDTNLNVDENIKKQLVHKSDVGKSMILTNDYTEEEFSRIVQVVDNSLDLISKTKKKNQTT